MIWGHLEAPKPQLRHHRSRVIEDVHSLFRPSRTPGECCENMKVFYTCVFSPGHKNPNQLWIYICKPDLSGHAEWCVARITESNITLITEGRRRIFSILSHLRLRPIQASSLSRIHSEAGVTHFASNLSWRCLPRRRNLHVCVCNSSRCTNIRGELWAFVKRYSNTHTLCLLYIWFRRRGFSSPMKDFSELRERKKIFYWKLSLFREFSLKL